MAKLKKPSSPTVSGKTVIVESIAGAIQYTLYRVKYILKNNFRLFDKRAFTTSDGKIFNVTNSTDASVMHTSAYTGEQIDEAVKQALGESST